VGHDLLERPLPHHVGEEELDAGHLFVVVLVLLWMVSVGWMGDQV
jgi:hypothetical protein